MKKNGERGRLSYRTVSSWTYPNYGGSFFYTPPLWPFVQLLKGYDTFVKKERKKEKERERKRERVTCYVLVCDERSDLQEGIREDL